MMGKKDLAILEVLRKNCRLPTREISEKTGFPITTIHHRIKKMEKEGIIKGYRVALDHRKMGKTIPAYVNITISYSLPSGDKISQEEVARKIFSMPEVEECAILTGTTDIIIKVWARDVDELNDFVINRLRNVEGVQSTNTAIVLKHVGSK